MNDIITKLRKLKVEISLVNSKLKINAQEGVITREILEEIKQNKESLIEYIKSVSKKAQYTSIKKTESKDCYQLSSSQQRLYFLYEFDKTSKAYNMSNILKLEGQVDKKRLKHTFDRLIQRHESLRTFIELVDREPVQRIADAAAFDIEYYALNNNSFESIVEKFIKPFDVSKAPLLRVGLIEISDYEFLLMVDLHHLISDGISQNIMIKDFMALYNDEYLTELQIQYKDYAEWQQSEKQKEEIVKQRIFWLEQFQEMPVAVELPIDFERPKIKSNKGNTVNFTLTKQEKAGIKSISEGQGVTLFTVLISVYKIFISKISNQEDIVIGTSSAGRQHPDLKDIMGMFVNTIALRSYPSGNITFKEFLSKVQSTTLSCFDNQDYQYETLVDEMRVERDTSRNPLFDVMFAYQNFEEVVLEIPGLRLSPYEWGSVIAKFDLTLIVVEKDDELLLSFEYSTDLFKKETIERFISYFKKVITSIIENIDIHIVDIEIINDAERILLLNGFNTTAGFYDRNATVVSLFETRVFKDPDKTAVIYEGKALSYQELNKKANQLAHYLREKYKIRPNDIVALMQNRSENLLITILAILKSGAAYVPVDPAYPKKRIEYVLADSKARFLIIGEELRTDLEFDGEVEIFCSNKIYAETRDNLDIINTAEDLCYLIYTSGSTGTPKGVMISHYNVVNFFAGMTEKIPVVPEDCLLAVTSTSFDISVLELLWTICSGIQVIIHPSDISLSNLGRYLTTETTSIDFSLFFFSSYHTHNQEEKYKLLLDAVKYGDQEGFKAVWTPERHFHDFGGLYPNPSVISSALAMVTTNIQLRSGSVVSPLHDELRIAEEWSVVDNLSNGRVGLSFASGWNANDFVLSNTNFADRHKTMYEQIATVRKLWAGESLIRKNGFGQEVDVKIYPKPMQQELPVWITTGGNEETFITAGAMGANVLTHFLGQELDQLGAKIKLYREAWAKNGREGTGNVSVMLHTYVGEDLEEIERVVEKPFIEYLKSSIGLSKIMFDEAGIKDDVMTEEAKEMMLRNAFLRYYKTSALIGTKSSCAKVINKLKSIGVNEIACLVDFGISENKVLEGLQKLKELKDLFSFNPDRSTASVTMLQSTPSFIQMIEGEQGSSEFLKSLKTLLIGGEAVSVSLIKNLQKDFTGKIYNMYGPTETTIWSTIYEFEKNVQKVSIGKPILNTQVYILNTALQLQPIGVPGDMYIAGEGLSKGYWERAELSKEHFIINPFNPGTKMYKTGDLAKWLPDGNIEFIGRNDHQVKIRGHRIELGEIEKKLLEYPKIKQAIVTAVRAEEIQYLSAYIIADESIDSKEIRLFLLQQLPDYMVPAFFVQIEEFPLTPNGKIDRKSLRPPKVQMEENYVAPSNEIEKKMVEIWAEVLKIEKEFIGIYSNFFEIGGHSLNLLKLNKMVNETFESNISIAYMFRLPTIFSITKFITEGDVNMKLMESSINEAIDEASNVLNILATK